MTELVTSTVLHSTPEEDCNNNGSKYKQHTPLTLACWNGDLDLVTFLINEGADPNGLTMDGILPIHFSCMRGKNLRVLLHLLDYYSHKVDINAGTEGEGKTPLMFACALGLQKTAEVLVRFKADLNKQDGRGQSAIFYAMKGGHTDTMQLLISNKASVFLRDDDNANLLHHLLGSFMRIEQSKFELILGYLVEEEGLNVNTRMRNGTTPLHTACQLGLVAVAQYLIQKGANLEAKKDCWETPLWSHIKSSPVLSKDMILMLFSCGANFHVKNLLGMGLLEYATQILENEELAEVLKEVQSILRRRRMEEMSAKRKAIWSGYGYERGASPVINFLSPPESPTGPKACDWGPEPVPETGEENKKIVMENGNFSDLGLSLSSSSSGSSSDSSSSTTSEEEDDSDSDSSSLSSISSDEEVLNKVEEDDDDQNGNKAVVQVPAVSTTTTTQDTSPAERVVTRQQLKRNADMLKSTDCDPAANYVIYGEDGGIVNISSDESGDDKANAIAKIYDSSSVGAGAGPLVAATAATARSSDSSSEAGMNMLRRSQRKSKNKTAAETEAGMETEGQAERIKRKKKAIVITISDSD